MKSAAKTPLIAIGIALTGYFIWRSIKVLDLYIVTSALTSPIILSGIFTSMLLYTSIIPISGWAWRRLLLKQNENWSTWQLARIMALTQIAKYIPGNVAQHASRIFISNHSGMGTRAILSTIGQETILAIAASIMVGSTALVAGGKIDTIPASTQSFLLIFVFGSCIAVLFLGSIEVKSGSTDGSKIHRIIARLGGLPGPKTVATAISAYSVNYLLIGCGLWLLARSMHLPESMDFPAVTAAFSLSWALGFLAPGAPAGLGAREGIMLLLLAGHAPDESLVMFVILARIATIMGDLTCFAIASIFKHHPIEHPHDHAT